MSEDATTAAAPPRRRGGQPGNLNAVKTGQYSPRFRLDLGLFPPKTRQVITSSISVALRAEVKALPYPPPPGARQQAYWRALKRVLDCMKTLDLTTELTHQDVIVCFHPIFQAEVAAHIARKKRKNKRTNRIKAARKAK